MRLYKQIAPWVDDTVVASFYYADSRFEAKTVSVAADRYIVQTPDFLCADVDGVKIERNASVDLDLSLATTWDTTSGTDYTVAASRAGKDFYIYLVQASPYYVVSANATYPTGYTADNSRKIAGFHCLCNSVGTISGHDQIGRAHV